MPRRMSMSMLVLILVVMLSSALPCFGADGGLRYSIMVSKFQNRSNWSGQWDLGDAWGAVLTDSLMQTGKFIVLGEKDMRKEAMDEQDLAASGRTAGGGKTVVTGQITPAQLLIKGDITHFADSTEGGGGGIGIGGFRIGAGGSNAEINAVLYVVDSSTGQVLASKKCYGKVSEGGLSLGLSRGGFSGDIGGFKKTNAGKAVELAVDEAVGFMVSKMPEIPWTGEIVMVKGDRVYINRGAREGVSVGHTFQVGRVEVLRDPKTGEVLDQTIEKAGTIEVVSVKEKISICKLTQGTGINKGMAVMRPE
jgi:curli biogenesis system outer membrane secretion channel CsgG